MNQRGNRILTPVTNCFLLATPDPRSQDSHLYVYLTTLWLCPFVRKTCRWYSLPLTVRETSFSPAPTRGTTARQTYLPASSCLTDFSVRRFSLLRTCSKRSQRSSNAMTAKAPPHLRKKQGSAMGGGPFNTLKATSPQLLKSNLGSELSGVKGVGFGLWCWQKERWNESEFRIKSTNLLKDQVTQRLGL